LWLIAGLLPHEETVWAQAGPGTKARPRSVLARLTLLSNGPDVSVYLNGALRGRTDAGGRLLVERLPAGYYKLRARKIGCKEYQVALNIVAGQSRRLRVNMLPASDPAELAYQRGEQLREEKKYSESVGQYEAALELRRQFPEARIGLARSLLLLNRHDEAQRQTESAIRERRAQDPEGFTVLGNVLRGAGQYEEAIASYRRALRLAKDFSPEAHTGLALSLDDMDQPEDAVEHFRKAIAQDGDGEPVLYNLLGNALLAVDRKREAIKALETYLKLAPGSANAPAIESLLERVREELAAQP
jgi:tetratricopeptide (TPR) repeat protein